MSGQAGRNVTLQVTLWDLMRQLLKYRLLSSIHFPSSYLTKGNGSLERKRKEATK